MPQARARASARPATRAATLTCQTNKIKKDSNVQESNKIGEGALDFILKRQDLPLRLHKIKPQVRHKSMS